MENLKIASEITDGVPLDVKVSNNAENDVPECQCWSHG